MLKQASKTASVPEGGASSFEQEAMTIIATNIRYKFFII
jgi:hypothetical protein